MSQTDTDVIIVGGGPVGMSLALLLRQFGVAVTLVERNPTTGQHPRSRGVMARTMEIFRQLGVDAAIRAGALSEDYEAGAWCRSMQGPVLRITRSEREGSLGSPMRLVPAPQDVVEAALAAAVKEDWEVDARWNTEMVDFEQDEGGVSVVMRTAGTGEDRFVRGRYLVGCDGAGSPTRRRLGIEMTGPDTLARYFSYYFRADLGHLPHARLVAGFHLIPEDPAIPGAMLLTANGTDEWMMFVEIEHTGEEASLFGATQGTVPDEPWSPAQLQDVVRSLTGLADLDVTLLDNVQWRMSRQVAKSFQHGRVFLAGDAAHRFPPTGAQGMNSGVADAHNLAWKIALVLQGAAHPALLDTYTAERVPVAHSNADFSVKNFRRGATVSAAMRSGDEAALRAAWLDLENQITLRGQSMGYSYETGAVIPDGTPAPPYDSRNYWPSDRPGARFPHVWLDVGKQRSTVDWFTTRFVLVCGPQAHAWAAAARGVADRGRPLVARRLPFRWGPFTFPDDGAVLVRPDGHIAWRPSEHHGDLAAALEAVMAELLGR